MTLDQEETRAMITLRIAMSAASKTIYYYVMPASRIRNPGTIVSAVDAGALHSGFANDQALIELFGKLGAV